MFKVKNYELLDFFKELGMYKQFFMFEDITVRKQYIESFLKDREIYYDIIENKYMLTFKKQTNTRYYLLHKPMDELINYFFINGLGRQKLLETFKKEFKQYQ